MNNELSKIKFLALDIGNTNIVAGVFQGLELLKQFRISTLPDQTSDELRFKIVGMCEEHWVDLSGYVVSSVVPSMNRIIEEALLKKNFQKRSISWITASTRLSFKVSTTHPEQVGSDRLVNAECAVRDYGISKSDDRPSLIIVDSGTATTICALEFRDGSYQYLGGAIMPGIELSMQTLASRAAKLFPVDLKQPDSCIGSTTATAIQSGILFGYSCMLDGMIAKFKKELTPGYRVVATGGVSQLLRGMCAEIEYIVPDLTLKGLAYLYLNQKTTNVS
ncbi:MAG: type III pantothenate kinase [Bacteriovoracia bacterium]